MSGPGNFLSFFNTKFLEFFIKPSVVSPRPLYNRRTCKFLSLHGKQYSHIRENHLRDLSVQFNRTA